MSGAHPPELCVVIATHDRRDTLRRCLDALCAQDADPAAYEVLVADDGSTDGTARMAESYRAPFALRVLPLPKGGKPAALNAAIEATAAGACLFLDDDIVASPELVGEHLRAHRADPSTLGIGALTQEPPVDADPYARAFAEIWKERYQERLDREAAWTDCYGANFSAPRSALLSVGGFAEELAAVEDLELAFRLCGEGCVPRHLPDAGAVHDDQKPGARILADEERFGVWCADFVRAHPATRQRLLGWFNELSIHEIALRRLLLAAHVPSRALARLGRLLPGAGRRRAWFGFVSRQAFWRGVRRAMSGAEWSQATGGVPVLMYHAFTATGETDRFVMPKRSFARQMRLLAMLRYRVIRFEDLATAIREGDALPRRAVAITIDDGYLDNLEIADRILRRRGFPATVFLVSARLGGENDWDADGAVAGRPLLSAAEVERMREGGFDVGAHTRTHVSLPEAPDEAVEREIADSRGDLERALGTEVRTFAYPYGRYDSRAIGAAAEAGFRGACTTYARRARVGDDPLEIPRIEIRGGDSIPRFLRKLWVGGG